MGRVPETNTSSRIYTSILVGMREKGPSTPLTADITQWRYGKGDDVINVMHISKMIKLIEYCFTPYQQYFSHITAGPSYKKIQQKTNLDTATRKHNNACL